MLKLLFLIIFIAFFCLKFYASDVTWKNWAKNLECRATILKPKNIKQLTEYVKKAGNEKAKIHAYGSSHSWNDIVCSQDYLINTNRLNKLISIDKPNRQITVQAGIKLSDLNNILYKNGMCLPNQAAITKQSIAGVISTATHGSGQTGTLATFVKSVKLLTSNGEIKNFSMQENSDMFPAIRTSLGMLGVMTEVTIQCERLFKVYKQEKITNWEYLINNYQKLFNENDFIEIRWYANDASVHLKTHQKIQNKEQEQDLINKNYEIDYSYKMLSGELNRIYMEEEIAIPIENFVQAAQNVKELILAEYKNNKNFDHVLFRFVLADKNNLLSPANNSDVVFFSITTRQKKNYDAFYKKFYNQMLKFNGKPHWGKINYLTKEDVQKLYGKDYEQFCQIRNKLDPNKIFESSFTKKIFD